ncbi:hypothetical protein TNCV_4850861 [Trichonephila clavipes]|nr:hypothetical protein TNCV_4850861 [Trichonephila clavipes]
MENPVCSVTKNSDKAKVLQDCVFVVWDECTMANKISIEAVNITKQDLRGESGSPVVKVSDHGWRVMCSRPVPLNTRRVGGRCMLSLSRVQTSSRWWGVVVRIEGLPAEVSSS